MDWKLEDHTANGDRGFLRILCDGEPAADIFPYAKGADPSRVTDRAIYMVEKLNGVRPAVVDCEACGNGIAKGDKYQPGYDGQCFCEKCAYSFEEAVESWSEPIADDDRAQLDACRKALADHLAAGGAGTDISLIVMA